MKKYILETLPQKEIAALNAFYAELLLDKVLRDFRIKQMKLEIDRSLQDRNKEEFFRLTEELKRIS
ncbi:IDEAL domain-containing protein [Metabacillus sediminilitoris]|uniref:IDEAL domain-containing protein n=1 Tax=Metabacillus sediminilitoris TaxID=2567941 RepID=UPI0018B0CEE7|nr:IDEAL domain-containing protein [Metabacillus sediminilitoris]